MRRMVAGASGVSRSPMRGHGSDRSRADRAGHTYGRAGSWQREQRYRYCWRYLPHWARGSPAGGRLNAWYASTSASQVGHQHRGRMSKSGARFPLRQKHAYQRSRLCGVGQQTIELMDRTLKS